MASTGSKTMTVGAYYVISAPIVNEQIYKTAVRLATWLNALAAQRSSMSKLVKQG